MFVFLHTNIKHPTRMCICHLILRGKGFFNTKGPSASVDAGSTNYVRRSGSGQKHIAMKL